MVAIDQGGPVTWNEDRTLDFQFLDASKGPVDPGWGMNGGDSVKMRFVNPADRTIQGSLTFNSFTGIAQMSLIDTDDKKTYAFREFEQKPDGAWKENVTKSIQKGNLNLSTTFIEEDGTLSVGAGSKKDDTLFADFDFGSARNHYAVRMTTIEVDNLYPKDPTKHRETVAEINAMHRLEGGEVVNNEGYMYVGRFGHHRLYHPAEHPELVDFR